jgi:hypothetical protein
VAGWLITGLAARPAGGRLTRARDSVELDRGPYRVQDDREKENADEGVH